jgi:hypothetical protein
MALSLFRFAGKSQHPDLDAIAWSSSNSHRKVNGRASRRA